MKILIIHCYYIQRGGEDHVFEQEYGLLHKHNDVRKITFKNKSGLAGGIQFFLSIWNVFAARRVKKEIAVFNPDVVHLHNWHFGCGPIIIRTVANANIPIVLTLHNYRLICPSATLLNKAELFLDSINAAFPWRAIKKGVYRNSRIQTFWLAFIVWVHKKINTWQKVSKYLVLSQPSQELFVSSALNIPAEKITIKPNFVEPVTENKNSRRNDYFLFVGRLSEEKGIKVLLNAFEASSFKLHIAGSGPLKGYVQDACANNPNILYLGNIDKSQVIEQMKGSTALIFPSIWHETFGLVIIEAFSIGLPVIASNIGAAKMLVQHGYNGRHFEPRDVKGLKEELLYWNNLTDKEIAEFQSRSMKTYKMNFNPERNEMMLLNIYEDVRQMISQVAIH